MAIHVRTTSAGPIGARPGGLQVVTSPMLAFDHGPSVETSATAGASAGLGGEGVATVGEQILSDEPYTPPRVADPIDHANQSFGGRPSGWAEIMQIIWRRKDDIRDAWYERVRDEGAARDNPNSVLGPIAEVRPQWLADP